MKNIIKKISILLLLVISFITELTPIKAVIVTSDTDGNSVAYDLYACSSWMNEGCGNISDNFVVRATIVNGGRNRIEGTRTLEFYPINTAYSDYIYHGEASDYDLAAKDTSINQYDQQWIDFGTSNFVFTSDQTTAIKLDEGVSENIKKYGIYMGYNQDDRDNIEVYDLRRETFISFISYLQEEINVPGIGHVNFLDFFYHESGFAAHLGYPDEWHGTHNNEINNEIAAGNYYIILEPVFEVSLTYNGVEHRVKGTAKQLAKVMYNSSREIWYWPMYNSSFMYNMFCGFRDYSGTFGLNTGYNDRCTDIDEHFNVTTDWNQEIAEKKRSCDTEIGYAKTDACNSYHKAEKKAGQIQVRTNGPRSIEYVYEALGSFDNSVGVNILDLSEIVRSNPPQIEERNVELNNRCEYEVNLCNNNATYESKLKSDDIFHCIYPSEIGISSDDINNYAFHVDNTDLWCYDDVKYDFTDLFNAYNNNSSLKTNQLALLPNGRLNVKRTCYSSHQEDFRTFLGSTDPNGANFQDTFVLNFNGTNYNYTRDGQRYQFDNGNIRKNDFLFDEYVETPQYENKEYYKYMTEFNYDIKPSSGTDGKKTNINIIDFSISESLGNTNKIIEVNETTMDGKLIYISKNKQTGYYNNKLSASGSGNTGTIGNSYGMGNKLYMNLKDGQDEELSSKERKEYTSRAYEKTSTSQEGNVITHLTLKNDYKLTRTTNPYCTFQTQISDDDIFGDGIIFRTISLSNPFPARDGTARIPGENWLGKNTNHVYDFITNNRGVKEEKLYSEKQPLYTITLDTQTMTAIREYNKSFSYKDLSISCTEGTGRECVSSFLRNHNLIKSSNISGTCAGDVNSSTFYSCADKTVASGG